MEFDFVEQALHIDIELDSIKLARDTLKVKFDSLKKRVDNLEQPRTCPQLYRDMNKNTTIIFSDMQYIQLQYR